MKKIAIYCVNYKSYDALHNYLRSLEHAASHSQESLAVNILVADNPDDGFQPIAADSPAVSIRVFPFHENLGYFGAIHKMMEQVSPLEFDYAIISNVDVLLDEDFFLRLVRYEASADLGWIAPQIYSNLEERDRNPKIMQRYPKRKLQVLQTLFRFPPLYNLYTHTAYKSKKLARHSAGEIYAGHGSFIILTRRFFCECGIIDYPVFLFCEEIYLGEQCRSHGLKVRYEPTLRVADAEHASTGTFKRSKYCRHNLEAITYILETYYA